MTKVEISFKGETKVIELDGDTILNKALDESIELPFGCMSGSCTTCMATLVEGEVTMEVDDVLTADDKAAGKVLTCQAVPKSDFVKIKVD